MENLVFCLISGRHRKTIFEKKMLRKISEPKSQEDKKEDKNAQ
jgi:hypothetical protein